MATTASGPASGSASGPASGSTSLRGALDALFTELPARLAARGSGAPVARAISDVYDRAIAARFVDAAAGARLALVATGGWARRELAPYSDIDFIVLHDRDEPLAKRVADELLYPLWDERLAIGHALREPRSVAKLAKDDLPTATALLDARHIAGDRALTAELGKATLAAVAPGGNPNELIAALAAEQRARHERFGAAIYVLEPNLKQGIGGLRDLATALWAAGARWAPPVPGGEPVTTEALLAQLVAGEVLSRRRGDVLAGARDFQLRLRTLVQLAARRRFDQLTFELQESIAPTLYPDARPHDGDVRAAVAPAVEALMQEYYLHAREVVQVTDRLLDAARVPGKKKPKLTPIDPVLVAIDGELALADPARAQPRDLVQLFRESVARQLPVRGATRELVTELVAREPAAIARDAAAVALVRDALCDLRDSALPSALERLHEVGLLAAVVPEWAPCTARVQHDLYHVYTVDQHQLYAVAMQKRLARGELAAEHPLATELWRSCAHPAALLLATLLHDVGKPLGKGHAEKGAVIAGAVAARLGLSAEDGELAEMLVRQHLTMSHLSQRRDLSDPEVVERFAERLGPSSSSSGQGSARLAELEQRLAALYLLTLCDTAMTAPENLSAWKDGLLRELMLRTRARLRGEPYIDGAPHAAVTGGTESIDPRLVAQLTPRQAARGVKLVETASGKRPPVALEVHGFPMKGHSELAVVAPDAPGALAAIAGALAAHRVDVLGAMLGHADVTGGARLVLDVFFVRDQKGAAIGDDDARWPKLLDDLRALCGGGAPDQAAVAALIARKRPKSGMPARVTPGVPTEIRLHDDSTQATIVEVSTRDRVGVLYAITHAIAELGLDISLAKIATEGEKVADTFYVTRGGARITDAAERAALVERLRAAVGEELP